MGNSLRVYASLFMLALLSLPLALPAALGQPMMGPMAGYMEFQSTNVYYPEAFYNRYEVNASMPAANMTGVDALLELSAFYSNGSLDGSLELNVSGPEFNATGSVSLDLMVAFTLNESNTSLMLSVFIDNSQFVPPGNGSLVLNVTVEADTRSRVDFVEGVQESAGTFTVWFSDKGDIARGAGVEELSVTVEGSFESTQNATHASFEVNATIDVDTDPPQAAPGIAFILSLVLQNLAQQLPPGVTMEVSISQEDPSVVIVRIYGTVELEAGLVMPGMPVEPPVPIEQIPQPQFNGSVIPVPGFESGSVSFSLDAAIEPSSATASATLSATIDGSLSVPGSIEVDSFNLVLRAESASDGQGSVYGLFEVNGTSAEPFTPFEINKAVLEAIADMLEDHIEAMRERGPMGGTVKALVEFFGFDGVMFADSFGVSDTVVFTEENLTEVEDLRLVYGGVDADVENGTLRIVSRGDAVIGLGHLLQASRALVVANSVEINAGPVSFVRDFELEIESEEGTISVTIEAGSSLSGPAVIGVLGPDTALEILEESGVARALGALQVIGPAVDVTVEREIEAVMELEIPVDVPPDADSIYVVIVDDGEYELATDFEIEDGVLRIILDEFSTIVPVAVEEAAPPEETETTTTTPAQTETSPPPETTTPETTTPPPEETTPEETTTPPPEETTETTTPPPETTPIETTTPSPTTTPATTPMQETTPEKTTPMMEETTQTTPAETGTTPSPTETVEGEEGGLSGRDIAVIIAVIVMVAAALLLLRRR